MKIAGGRVKAGDPRDKDDPHLRSTKDVDGHAIEALDGQVGHAEYFVIDDETWTIRYLIVGTRNWWPGKKVLIATRSIDRISWADSTVYLRLKRETIQKSPEYSEGLLISRDYEAKLQRHYDLEGHWQKALKNMQTR